MFHCIKNENNEKKIKLDVTPEGFNYPKHKVLELIETFGLFVDLDKWVEKDFMRIQYFGCKEVGCVIIHREDLEANVHQEKEYIEDTFRGFLLKTGEVQFKKKIKSLMEIE